MDKATTPFSGTRRISLAILFAVFLFSIISAPPLCADTGNFVWAKAMGGTLSDYGYKIAVDSPGNIYTIGYFQETVDFDPGSGTFNLTSNGGFDIFVIKLDSSGNLSWAGGIGGALSDFGNGITIDSDANIYITGSYSGTVDFDPSSGTFNLTSSGSNDVFISKLDSSGNLIWAKSVGGTTSAGGYDIAVDSNGNVYTTGFFQDTVDFDPGNGTFNLTSNGINDIFITKLDSNGNLLWAKSVGGTLNDYGDGNGIAVDSAGNVYTTGLFKDIVDFDPGPGTFNLTSNGGNDIFISKLDSNGNLVWTKSVGGALNDYGYEIVLDSVGNVYTTGAFRDTIDFDPGPGTFNLTSSGSNDAFISKLDSNGNLVWARSMGGALGGVGYGVAVDPEDNVYATGDFQGTVDFDPGPGTYNLTSNGDNDIFITKLNSSGNLSWAGAMGGLGSDTGWGIAIDSEGNIHATGTFSDMADFYPGHGTYILASQGDNDIFISKLAVLSSFPWPMFLPAITNKSQP